MKTLTIFIFGLIAMTAISCTKEPAAQVDEVFAAYTGNVPGAAVMVIHNGKPVLTKTYGMANLESQTPITPQTNFRLASVSKAFTAMCVLMLIEDDYLTYDATLCDIFPDFPEYGKQITIRNLLQHTSGLIDYESLMPDTATAQVHDSDALAMMMAQDSTYFAPGSDYSYSNTGYALLAMIVEKIGAMPYPEFLKTRIFEPLGMSNTLAFVNGYNSVPNRAFGYTVHEDSIEFTDQSSTSAVLGDGGIYSSLEDMFKWDQALLANTLVGDSTMQLAYTPNLETYGFGWRIDEVDGHRRIHHNGSTRGFRNCFQRFPDDNFAVIVLTNRNSPESVQPLAEKVVEIYWQLLKDNG